MPTDMEPIEQLIEEFDSFLGIGAYQNILWRRASIPNENYDSTAELDLRCAIAAQHLNLWQTARTFAQEWAAQTGLHQTAGPKITIVIPTFNRPDTLERALKSVSNQLYRPLEIVVVNDAGRPVSSIIDRYREHLEIIEVNNPQNLYLAGARNQGIRWATGTFVNFLDDDDQLYPHHIGHLLYLAESSGLPASQALSLRQTEGRALPHRAGLVPQVAKPFELSALAIENVTPVQTILLKRSLFDTIGYFDEGLLACEDWEQWIRLRRHTPIMQSTVVTSWIESRNLNHRMSTATRAPFLGARARIYTAPITTGLPEPTALTLNAQRETLRHLAHAVFEEISATQTVSVGLMGSHASPKLDEMLENEWSDFLHPVQKNLLSLNSFQEVVPSNRLTQEMRQLAKESSDYCVLVEENLLFHLGPGWGTALIGHLAGGKKRFGACPRTETLHPSVHELGSSTVLSGPIPGCIVLKTESVLKIADYAEQLSTNLSLNQLLLNYNKELNHHIIQAKEIGFGSKSLQPIWLNNSRKLNTANQFKTKSPTFPLLKARYNFCDEGSENKSDLFGINPTVLYQHFRYLNSQFLLTPEFCPILQQNPNDRRPRLTVEFVCPKEIFDFQVQPIIECAGILSNSVNHTQEPIETLDEYDAIILCNEKSLQEVQASGSARPNEQNSEEYVYQPKHQHLSNSDAGIIFA